MTACDVFIEDFGDAEFDWEHGGTYKSAARSSSPLFPPMRGHYHHKYHEWVKQTGVRSEKTDWGTWVAEVTKTQIGEFLEYVYGDEDRCQGPDAWSGFVDALVKVRAYVETLDPEGSYALVACES